MGEIRAIIHIHRMTIYIANDSSQTQGGGFTFLRNLRDGLPPDVEITQNMREANIVFIPSSTMAKSETVEEAKNYKKPIVLRVDNLPKNSRNRNTGTSRLKAYHDLASAVIYQSRWAKDYLSPWLDSKGEKKTHIVLNGVNQEIFNKTGPRFNDDNLKIFVYSRFNRDETKGWHEAWYHFQLEHRRTENAALWIVGNFSPEQSQYNFDFYQGEAVRYWGVVEDPNHYAKILRTADTFYAPYFNDAASNALIEALSCGLEVDCCESGYTGGAPEIFEAFARGYDFSLQHMVRSYLSVFGSVI